MVETVKTILGWIPLTARSVLSLALLVWVRQVYGVERSDLVLLVLGTGGLFLVGVTTAAVLALGLTMRLRRPPASAQDWMFSTGAPFRTGFELRWEGWMPLVKVDLQWESPADVSVRLVPSRGRLAEEVTASRRSAAQSVVRRWTISDAFGMARISFRQQVAQAVKIMPAAGQIRPHELLHQMSSGDLVSHPGGEAVGDLMETRPYTHGDPLKRVLWRAYARTRRLLVRMPEKAIAPRQKTLAYLVADRRDEPAAGVARSALEQGVFGRDFLFCADGEQAPTSEVPEAIEQIVRSAAAVDSSGQGLADFMAVGQARGSRSCVVFAPVSQGPWLELVERESRARKGQLSVVLTVEDVRSVRTQSLWRRLVLKGDGGRLHSVAELRQVWDRLVRSGIGVTVIDRSSGHALHPSALSALSKRRFGGGA